MLLTFGLLDEAQVEALREKGYAIFFAKVSQTDSDWLEEALRVKVNKAKDGDANFCLFVNVDSDGFVDALAEDLFGDVAEKIIDAVNADIPEHGLPDAGLRIGNIGVNSFLALHG